MRWKFRAAACPAPGFAFPSPGIDQTRYAKLMSAYSVYLVRCRDGSLYTGIATDVARRLAEHEDGVKGAKYLRGKGPLTLVFKQEIGDRSLASKIESRIKRLTSAEKADVNSLSERIGAFLLEMR